MSIHSQRSSFRISIPSASDEDTDAGTAADRHGTVRFDQGHSDYVNLFSQQEEVM